MLDTWVQKVLANFEMFGRRLDMFQQTSKCLAEDWTCFNKLLNVWLKARHF